jgi:hypothetical protein
LLAEELDLIFPSDPSTNKVIFSVKLICILSTISFITSGKNLLKNTASTTFLSLNTNKVQASVDPKSLFKPEADTCSKPDTDTAFEDSYPRRSKNFFDKIGFNEGPITYLIDYMEQALEKDTKNIQKEFKIIFDEAKQSIAPEGVKDPYYLAKIATQKGNAKEDLKPEDYYRMIQAKVPDFNIAIYEASVTIPQLVGFFKTNKWTLHQDNLVLEAKTLVDKYDFNGDGRLNFREFILAMIFKTEDLVRAKICSKCLENIVEEAIDPIFTFIDCEKKDMVTAEEIWKTLAFLIRKNDNLYNIYTCKIVSEVYRTSSINDFVLKAHKSHVGYLTRKEFREGLFLAYWDRYTTEKGLLNDEVEAKLKIERWGNGGKDDNVCGNIHKQMKIITKEVQEEKEEQMKGVKHIE